jgi:hypothetical protein
MSRICKSSETENRQFLGDGGKQELGVLAKTGMGFFFLLLLGCKKFF